MVKVYAVKLDEALEKSKFDRMMSHVLKDKYDKIISFHRFKDAQRTLIGDILIRYLICNKLKIRNNTLKFGFNQYGKPYFCGCEDINFNISHSGEWVVCCLDSLPVGIDVEQIKPIDFKIVERFFSREEYKSLMEKKAFQRTEYFYELWTLKESYIKAVGKGLSIPVNSFTIRMTKSNITVDVIDETEKYYFRQYYLNEGYKMAVCSKSNNFENNLKLLGIFELYEKFLTVS